VTGLLLNLNGGLCTFWLGMRKVSCLKKLLEDASMGACLNTVLKCMQVLLMLRWVELDYASYWVGTVINVTPKNNTYNK